MPTPNQAATPITPRRALQVNFSQPLANSGISIATNTNKTQNISALRHLNAENVVITVVADTLAHSVAEYRQFKRYIARNPRVLNGYSLRS